MKNKHLLSTLLLGAGLAIQTSCAPTYPGGLSEAEWNSLEPEKRAELKLKQEQVDAARMANIEQELNRSEMRREHEENMKKNDSPSIKLSPEDTAAINALTH